MSAGGDFGNPLRKFKLVFLGEQSGECAAPPLLAAGRGFSAPPPNAALQSVKAPCGPRVRARFYPPQPLLVFGSPTPLRHPFLFP